MKLSSSFSGALRSFAYFLASGHHNLIGTDYLDFFGKEPSAIEQVFAIFANVIELDQEGNVVNANYAEERATNYLKEYTDPDYVIEPPYEDWEIYLH